MAVTKTTESITQLTTTGQSTVIDVSDSYRSEIYIKAVTGVSATADGVIQVEARATGSTGDWYDVGGAINTGQTAQTLTFVVQLPDAAAEVRIDWTYPTGSTSSTLDAEVAQITGI